MLTFQRNKLLRLRTKGYLSDSEPMREANTSLQELFTMCKEFSQVLSTASIFKNTDWWPELTLSLLILIKGNQAQIRWHRIGWWTFPRVRSFCIWSRKHSVRAGSCQWNRYSLISPGRFWLPCLGSFASFRHFPLVRSYRPFYPYDKRINGTGVVSKNRFFNILFNLSSNRRGRNEASQCPLQEDH